MSDPAPSKPSRTPPRRRAVELYLGFATLLALAPAVLLLVGLLGAETGASDWRGGLGLFVLEWAPRLALVGVAGGALALVVALLAGFGRYWRWAMFVLAITTATLGAYVWTLNAPV